MQSIILTLDPIEKWTNSFSKILYILLSLNCTWDNLCMVPYKIFMSIWHPRSPTPYGKFNIGPNRKIFWNYSYLKSQSHLTANIGGMCLGWSLTKYICFFLYRLQIQDGCHHRTYLNIWPYGEKQSQILEIDWGKKQHINSRFIFLCGS